MNKLHIKKIVRDSINKHCYANLPDVIDFNVQSTDAIAEEIAIEILKFQAQISSEEPNKTVEMDEKNYKKVKTPW